MKILHTVELYPPSVGGMQEVVKQLSERLVSLGHQVFVATARLPERNERTLNGVHIVEFGISGNLAIGMSGEVERYQRFLLDSTFDVITNFAAQQWATDAMITILDRISARKVFVPTGFSRLYTPQYSQYFAAMPSWMKQYDMNVFLSDDYRDINFARENGITDTILIPNGAGEDEFSGFPDINIRQRLNIPQEDLLVLHVGSHTGSKGHTEALEIFSKARISNATFLLVANDLGGGCACSCRRKCRIFNLFPSRWKDNKKVIVTTLPRKETVAAYQAADLFLFPSNIECSPLVLFECMASRTAFLSTDVGNAAEIITWSGGGGLVPTVQDPDGYSRVSMPGAISMFEEIAADMHKREQMADNGYNAWLKRFTWGKIAESYEKLYYTLTEGSD